ncbi:MAG: hypothetical protein RIA62_15190 [Cyclobacteriaceae bacterium]
MDELAFLRLPDVRSFILANEHGDVQKLVLNPPKQYKDQITLIADQIISRRKLKNKLPEWVESVAILPPPLSAEQASSSETARYKSEIFHGDHLVDLTGGAGVDTLSLSTRFRLTVYVEPNEWLCRLFEHNQKVFSDQPIAIHQTTAEQFLKSFNSTSAFFIDPSRRVDSQKVFRLEDCVPNLSEILPILSIKGTEALIKLSPMIDISEAIRQLSNVKAVHVVSIKNECKEVLFHLDFSRPIDSPPVICVNLNNDRKDLFQFSLSGEKAAKAVYGNPGRYIYDANTSILKAGAFHSVATQFQLQKIAPNTHLYTSDDFIGSFPGRCFEVIEGELKPNAIKELIPKNKANIITKNYPMSSEALGKKLKLKDGGSDFVIGFRTNDGKPKLVLCQRIY